VLNKLFGVPSINFGDENIYFGATTILFGGALNGCQKKFVGSGAKIRVGRVTGNQLFFFFYLT
jgi:hypothetical protein